jgi:hypothetical protein
LAATPVKAPASSATSMTLPMWLLEWREGTRGDVHDEKAKNTVEAHDFKSSLWFTPATTEREY